MTARHYQRRGGAAWERGANARERGLIRAYNGWSASTKRMLQSAATRGISVVGIRALMTTQVALLETILLERAANLILAASRQVLKKRKLTDVPAVQGIILSRVQKTRQLISNSLIPAIGTHFDEALALGIPQQKAALDAVFAVPRSRVGSYVGGYWVMIFEVQRALGKERERERAVEGQNPERVRWNLDPLAQHCTTGDGRLGCDTLEGIYPNWDALPTVPAGEVRCLGN